jgi:transketolase C-terminal domain/subunit
LRRAQAHILDGAVFEQLGVQYLGPIDGHDLPLLIEVLRDARQLQRPAVLHLITRKGKGYRPSEQDPTRYHGVPPFDAETGQPLATSSGPSYAEVFGDELIRMAEADSRVVAITAAMSEGTGLAEFARRYPARFFDVGIAEQHAVTFAAGLAVAGARPVVAIYSTFLQRGYDQVIHDVCLQNLPVTFVLDRAGLVGEDGPTHHGLFDLAYLRTIPRMVIMAPKDQHEFRQMLRTAIAWGRPVAVRTPRGTTPVFSEAPAETALELGRGELLRAGRDVGLVAIGSMVLCAMEAARALQSRGISAQVVNARFVKPLDTGLIVQTARQVKRVYVLEEHVRHGGFGSAVLELMAEHQVCVPASILALPDDFIEHGSAKQLLDRCGLSADKVVSRILADLEAEPKPRPAGPPTRDPARLQAAIDRVRQRTLPAELAYWVQEYGKVGHRHPFLWNWCLEGVTLTTLPCVDPELHESVCATKLLGVMLDVLLDDVADQSGPADYLEQVLKVPFAAQPPDFTSFSPEQQAYADTVRRVWGTIVARAEAYPRYAEFSELWCFDYLQLLNAMRYSHLINRDPRLLNLVEHDLYLPHNMHMMISSTLDLMCSRGFDRAELGRVREVVWHAQCMGRIGNLITTWERELGDRDFTSGVYAFAVREGLLTPQDLMDGDKETLRQAIASHDCEAFFLGRWRAHRDQIVALASSIRSVDIPKLVAGLERLVELHLGSRGLK